MVWLIDVRTDGVPSKVDIVRCDNRRGGGSFLYSDSMHIRLQVYVKTFNRSMQEKLSDPKTRPATTSTIKLAHVEAASKSEGFATCSPLLLGASEIGKHIRVPTYRARHYLRVSSITLPYIPQRQTLPSS